MKTAWSRNRDPQNKLGWGIVVMMVWLLVIVIGPLAAVVRQAYKYGWVSVWQEIISEPALQSLKVTVTLSCMVTIVNLVFGSLIAWVLVRDKFPGKELVNLIIDLPFALPTIVVSLVLLSLYGPMSPIGIHLEYRPAGVLLAMSFVTLPFVVRTLQPVLQELDHDVEEAAAVLGASSALIVRKLIFPAVAPALFSGAGLAFSRSMGEFGSVVLISGSIPGKTEVASQWIRTLVENDDHVGAASVSLVILGISFGVLVGFGYLSRQLNRR